MNVTGRREPGEAGLAETIAHEPGADSGPLGPSGIDPMMTNTAKGQARYVFSSGARPLEGYTIRRAIGRGGFGEVYYATSDAGKEVALKLITRNLDVERRGVVQCMNLKSPHLIAIHDLRTNDEGDTFVIMEYVAGPSLAQILEKNPKGLPIAEVRAWLKGLVEGVGYLHDHGIVHRDLKPANLFLEEGVVKIGDYGLTKAITQSRDSGHSESVGTCHYMAPEISKGKYNKPIDIYALGIILHEMLTGRVPFDGESVGEVLMKHLTSRPDLAIVPEPYRAIVARALAKDPAQRPASVQDLLLPADSPREPEIRIVGDPGPHPSAPSATPDEEIHRIGAEETVLYIGPETRPLRPRRTPNPSARPAGVARLLRAARARQAATAAARVDRRPAPAPAPVVAPPIPPPVPLPSARVRLAEAATSMLAAALGSVLASAVVFPLYQPLGIDLPTDPSQLAILFGTTLLGCWGVLIPMKLWEGSTAGFFARRGAMLVVGLIVGAFSVALAVWAGMGTGPGLSTPSIRDGFVSWAPGIVTRRGFASNPATMIFFGLAMASAPWASLTARDRPARFRFLPVYLAGLFSGLIGAVMPAPSQPWGLIVMLMIAVIVQLVTPWDRSAAEVALLRKHARAA